MELNTAINLIENAVAKSSVIQAWADLGAGKGLFTNALATLLAKGSTIYAVDNDEVSLNTIELLASDIILKKIRRDFSNKKLEMDQLDGILMANSLHYVQNKISLINQQKNWLKASGGIIVVEYDRDTANQWVPFPIRYARLQRLAEDTGFTCTKIGEAPSRFQQASIYAAVLMR